MNARKIRPISLQNPELRTYAQLTVKKLRALPPGHAFDQEGLTWLIELVQTLVNRLPHPRPQTRGGSRRR